MLERDGLRERLGLGADASDAEVIARLADAPDLRAELQGGTPPVHPTGTVPGDLTLQPRDYLPPQTFSR